MSWNLLERFIESEHFNKDPSLTVAYLARYAEHVGIHYVLCSKLRQFSYEEIEFFLPQLCHLVISIDNESMALEVFILDLCEESVNGALLTYWLLQTYLHDLSATPTSNAFQTCRRIFDKVQRIVFGGGEGSRRERIQENVLPVTVLSSLVLASVAVPWLPGHAGPLAIAQARRPRPVEELVIEGTSPALKLGRSATVTGSTSTARRKRPGTSEGKEGGPPNVKEPPAAAINGVTAPLAHSDISQPEAPRKVSQRRSMIVASNLDGFSSTASLPDAKKAIAPAASLPSSPGILQRPTDVVRRHSHAHRPVTPSSMSRSHKIRLLRRNYFRNQSQFLSTLEGISSRLVAVPKPARLSALRAELALVAQDLPAEVDVPLICPATLIDGSAARSKHHRIVRLNPSEATSLNSAQKVPFLLMLEVLRDDFDFDPESEQNTILLTNLLAERGQPRRRPFDISDAARQAAALAEHRSAAKDGGMDAAGDLSTPMHLRDMEAKSRSNSPSLSALKDVPMVSSAASPTPSIAVAHLADAPISRSISPGMRQSSLGKSPDPNQTADHMRVASQMLAQLELSAAKRPKTEVAAIKARIIASMQSLEEQSFLSDDTANTSFDTIMANAGTAVSEPEAADIDDVDTPTDPSLSTGKGAARMENDAMTGGIQRKGDRDDPSAAMFGEAWEEKKERIRRSSPYGWVKNWDLVSVIVKTGDDLRQEAFACQLIAVCSRIWAEHDVDVWVKNMRILVTGETTGLLETITNAVSLHSLKRSLTLASIAAGTNPKKRFATLQDHYIKTFGPTDSPGYARAVDRFVKSLAAYSTISYILQLKDRHNGNILIDSDGHVIHIDFGFMLSNSPGNMGFEAAPFKLPLEYVELLGGLEGPAFIKFKDLMKDAFQALRREAERIVTLVELMGRESKMPCYGVGVAGVVAALRARFVLEKSREEARDWVEDLVAKSVGSYYTRLYDSYQYRTQGIY